MSVQLKPETERLVDEEIKRGHFQSVDDLIVQGVCAWREKHHVGESEETPATSSRPQGKKSLAQLFAESPFRGLAMNFERFPDILPPVDL
jgi:Arc/MetJ-type ribon-helix-helix transcriptional regulator